MNKIFLSRLLLLASLVLILLIYVFPYAYLVLTSFKPPNEAIAIPPTLIPTQFSVENYLRITNFPVIPKSFLNSLIIALISTSLAITLAVPAAYAISRYGTRPGRIFLVVALITRMIPYVSVAIPFFGMMRRLGLTNTYLGVALAHTTINLPLAIWLLSSFLEAIPTEIEEAARVDGCSRFSALIRVIIPIALGGIAVTAIFAFLASWNEFLFSLLLTSNETKTAPIAISEFKTQYGVDWGTMTSLSVLYSFPVIVFSLFMQKRIVAGMTMGAVKG